MQITLLMVMVMVMVMAVIMGMRVGMAVVMRVGMIMMVGVIMVVLIGLIMPLVAHRCPYPVVVVMDIPLMVIVVVNDQGARCTLLMVMMVMGVMSMIVFMTGDPRLTASAYATHINLPRCR
ncbi:hypothetical protein ACK350_19615 [Aeromonas veronii]